MFRTVTTLFRAGVAEADEDLQDRTASTLLAQHLRDAKAELARHKAGLAALMARETKEARLEQALAEKLTRRESEVETALTASDDALAADIADDMLRIEVCDDGPGIAAEMRERLFQPFVSGRSDGTGLGLAIVARIVEAHRGRVEIVERADWATCFALHLPCRQEATP